MDTVREKISRWLYFFSFTTPLKEYIYTNVKTYTLIICHMCATCMSISEEHFMCCMVIDVA